MTARGEPGAGAAPRASVLSLGETLIDLIVSDGAPRLETADAFVARAGGAPANVAVALARLGVPSAFAGVVGDDPFGQRLRTSLGAEGVDVAHLHHLPGVATTLAFAWKDERGDGHFWLLRDADLRLTPEYIAAAAIGRRAAIIVGSVALAGEPSRTAVNAAVERAVAHEVPVCFDINIRPSLWPDLAAARAACAPIMQRSRLIKFSLDDARHLFGRDGSGEEMVREMISRLDVDHSQNLTGRVVVLTDGERGCWYAEAATPATIRHVRAFRVKAVEPTGAGDAFTAALLSRLLNRGWEMPDESDLRYAAAAGALATTRAGAWEGLPSATDLAAFMAGADNA